MMYTLKDLETARQNLKHQCDRSNQYSGNNPNKYRSDIKSARSNVRIIEDALKTNGEIPLSEQELLEKDLDKAFPDASNKQIVQFQKKNFQRRFWPADKSNTGKTVTRWERSWAEIK
jgi:hypothetical protein